SCANSRGRMRSWEGWKIRRPLLRPYRRKKDCPKRKRPKQKRPKQKHWSRCPKATARRFPCLAPRMGRARPFPTSSRMRRRWRRRRWGTTVCRSRVRERSGGDLDELNLEGEIFAGERMVRIEADGCVVHFRHHETDLASI